MRYKTYTAETLQQAILKMTIDLGKDAMMVSHRYVKKGGIFGLFGKRMVEVTAAVPIKPNKEETIRRQIQPIPSIYPEEPNYVSDTAQAIALIQKELKEIKSRMDNLMNQGKLQEKLRYPGKSGELYVRLIQNEVEEKIAENLIRRVIAETPDELLEDEDYLERKLVGHISNIIRIAPPLEVKEQGAKAVAFVGPTGVGKTTTLAKLAAEFTFDKRNKVAIITVDTYRIAAVEQLKTYADIMGLPLEVVFSPSEFKVAIDMHKNADLILIDTAGRSQRNTMQLAELKGFIDAAGYKLEVFLLLSAVTKDKELIDTVENFRRVAAFNKLIFTKLDEAVTCGPILNLLVKIPQGLSYITTGQNVPEDIEVADAERLAKLIVGVR
jgi:flagellar biosynthesis protein FlhF